MFWPHALVALLASAFSCPVPTGAGALCATPVGYGFASLSRDSISLADAAYLARWVPAIQTGMTPVCVWLHARSRPHQAVRISVRRTGGRGEIGRRNGLKIRRLARVVRVQVPPSAPCFWRLRMPTSIRRSLFLRLRVPTSHPPRYSGALSCPHFCLLAFGKIIRCAFPARDLGCEPLAGDCRVGVAMKNRAAMTVGCEIEPFQSVDRNNHGGEIFAGRDSVQSARWPCVAWCIDRVP